MNPFDALLVRRGDLAQALDDAIADGGPQTQSWRVWREKLRDDPDLEAVCAFVSRSGGEPHPYDICLQQLGAEVDMPSVLPDVGVGADSVRNLGRELLDLPTLPQVDQYTGGLGDDEPM